MSTFSTSFMGSVALAALMAGPAASHERKADAPPIFKLPPDFYPESIDVSHDGTFYIGSWRQGAIARLRPGQTTAEIFIAPGSNGLTNVQGVMVDERRGRLWACSGDVGFTNVPRHPSALKSFDLETGKPVRSYDLPGGGHCNDLAMASDGRIYVTDSFHPRILVLDSESSALRSWLDEPRLKLGAAGYSLNGIAIDTGDVVYASFVDASTDLVRIPIKPDKSPGDLTQVTFRRTLKNADGVRALGNGSFLLFESNAFAKDDPLEGDVSLAHVNADGTTTLQTLVHGLADPSSGVTYGGRLYTLETKYEILFRQKPDDTSKLPPNVLFAVDSVPMPPIR